MPVAGVYCIDTSSIIRWFVEIYPPTIFPALQARVEGLVADARLRAPKEVFREIARQADECHDWAKGQVQMFVEESADVQEIVRALMAAHHNAAKPLKGINGADPFVIAMAKVDGARVVADENQGSQENRKIPFVCAAEGGECVTFQEMMLAEGWRF
jgi:uncharacterized protein DUF4411